MVPDLVIIGSDNLDRTIVVRIKGVKYEYWFHGEIPLTTVRKILRYSSGRAIDYLNRRSYKVVNMNAKKAITSTSTSTSTNQG